LSPLGTTEGGAAVSEQGDEFDGQGATFHDAADDAWKKAKAAGKGPGWFEVKKIEIRCDNPIREYKVKIKA
jgi:hypothetical protein